MAQASPLWYILWVAVAVFGVLTWYLDKFSQRREAIRLSAICGIISMLAHSSSGHGQISEGLWMELTDLEHHPLADKYPVRLPVWWCRTGEAGPHPDVEGVTGKTIVLRFEKTFGRIERFFAKLMKAPT